MTRASGRYAIATLAALVAAPAGADDLEREMQRLPAVEPAEASRTFVVQRGFRMILAAHEPDVCDPVDGCFDEQGRLYVAEFRSYPYSAEIRLPQQPEPLGRKDACVVRRLEDKDGDGVFETSVVFADRLSWVVSVCCYGGGLFVLAPDTLYYLQDTDGDGQADDRRAVLTGFSRYNVQALANNMKWGPDHRIYVAGGMAGGELFWQGHSLGDLRGADFRFDPRGVLQTDPSTGGPEQPGQPFRPPWFERLTGGQQFGNSFDDWGHRFVCSNSNHIQQIVMPLAAADRTTGFAPREMIRSIAAEGPAAPVFRISPAEPWRIVRTRRRAADPEYQQRLPPTELVATGFFTSATGVTIYRGDAYPDEFRGQAFIGDVGGNLVHRKTLSADGASWTAGRADAGCEFIASSDTWFRPVNFINAPDGCLYVLDMYRETIEHPYSIPEDIKHFVDLESGHDRGRIWRLEPPGWRPAAPPRLGDFSTAELVPCLAHGNAWHRETAERLIWERQDRSIVPALQSLLTTTPHAIGRAAALTALDGLGALSESDVATALDLGIREDQPQLAAAATRAGGLVAQDPGLAETIFKTLPPGDPRWIRFAPLAFELALAMGGWPDEQFCEGFVRLGQTQAVSQSSLLSDALLSSVEHRAAATASIVIDRLHAVTDAPQPLQSFVEPLVLLCAAQGDAEFVRLINKLAAHARSFAEWAPIVRAACTGLRRQGSSLAELLKRRDLSHEAQAAWLQVLSESGHVASDSAAPEDERIRALELLVAGEEDVLMSTVAAIDAPQATPGLQAACVRAVSESSSAAATTWLLDRWVTASPQLRLTLLQALVQSATRAEALLAAVADGRIQPVEIPLEQRALLVAFPSASIRDQAGALFSAATADRAAVIADYASALESGRSEAGLAVYRKSCASCHREPQAANPLGPPLTSVRNKSAQDLLLAILDPNREALPQYLGYSIVTSDGRIANGLLAAETATSITLRRSNEPEDLIVPRNQLEFLKASGQSLMPVGLEKELTPQDAADVIAWIRSL